MNKILEQGRNCAGLCETGPAGVVIDGRNFYRAFYRAAEKAERYILLAGWQFDSDVRLLRGEDSGEDGETTLLTHIRNLTERRPELRVYILAWDFSVLFAVDREWFQDVIFRWRSEGRISFRFDDRHAVGASHHQKIVVIDGKIAFTGGLDICSDRWDDRPHGKDHSHRKNTDGGTYEPYHDIQCFVTDDAAREVAEVFRRRWVDSGAGELDLPDPGDTDGAAAEDLVASARPYLPLPPGPVAVSRTRAKTLVPLRESVREIRELYIDAISAAERSIYLENQFFSSEAVYRALIDRLRRRDGGRLEVVIVLPRKPHTFVEKVVPGAAQARMLGMLLEGVRGTGHSLGVYYPMPEAGGGEAGPGGHTHVHSKLLMVDDSFLTIGSANTTNRSMGLDTELNLAWEGDDEGGLARSIRRVRGSLLAEHTGLGNRDAREHFRTAEDLVAFLDGAAEDGSSRLLRHTRRSVAEGVRLPGGPGPEEDSLDLTELDFEDPIVEESVFELFSPDRKDLFSRGITLLNRTLAPEGAVKHSLRRLSGWRPSKRATTAVAAALILD